MCNHDNDDIYVVGLDNQTYVLKSHMHLMCLDVIKEVFPDACFVFTYRKLPDVVGSFCSLTETVSTFKGKHFLPLKVSIILTH